MDLMIAIVMVALAVLTTVAASLAMRGATRIDWDYELAVKHQRVQSLEHSLDQLRRSAQELGERSCHLKLSRDVRLLMDEWQPAEGTPLHWSLNWILEPA